MRDKTNGFTLLETLIAFAIGSMVIISGFSVVAQTNNRQAKLQGRLDLARFARATLIEYAITFPTLSTSGIYAEKWSWKISEAPLPQANLEAVGLSVEYVKIDITVSDIHQPNQGSLSLSTAVARRVGGF
ncbi:MAG: type II secretion system protein [Roseobacter sp.]